MFLALEQVSVTYPGAGDVLTFVRGYEDGSRKATKIDWATIARLDGTIVRLSSPRGVDAVTKSAPDGYTIVLNTIPLVTNQSLFDKLGWDPIRDFAPIGMVATSPHVLVVPPKMPVAKVEDLTLTFIRSIPKIGHERELSHPERREEPLSSASRTRAGRRRWPGASGCR